MTNLSVNLIFEFYLLDSCMKFEATKGFNNLVELNNFFFSEEICRKYVSHLRWDNNPVCPHCHNIKVYEYLDGKIFKCAKCRKQFSVRAKTIFEDSKIPLKKWFSAIYLVTSDKNGTSSAQLSRDLEVTQKTAWFMLHKIKQTLRVKSLSKRTGVYKKQNQEPMAKWLNKPFEEVLKKLMRTGKIVAGEMKVKVENRKSIQDKTANNCPSKDFDPETD